MCGILLPNIANIYFRFIRARQTQAQTHTFCAGASVCAAISVLLARSHSIRRLVVVVGGRVCVSCGHIGRQTNTRTTRHDNARCTIALNIYSLSGRVDEHPLNFLISCHHQVRARVVNALELVRLYGAYLYDNRRARVRCRRAAELNGVYLLDTFFECVPHAHRLLYTIDAQYYIKSIRVRVRMSCPTDPTNARVPPESQVHAAAAAAALHAYIRTETTHASLGGDQ